MARQDVVKLIPSLAAYRGKLGQSAKELFQALLAISDVQRTILKLDTYATLLSDQDMRVASNQQKRQLAADALSQLDQATAWVLPEVIAIGPARINAFIMKDANLKRFAFPLAKMLRQAPHSLPAQEESILAAAGAPLSASAAIQRAIVTSRVSPGNVLLSDGRSIPVDDRSLASVPTLAVRSDRKTISDAYWSSFSNLQGALGATLSASIRADIFNARSRRYKSSLEASLFALNIPVGAYKTMLAEVNTALPVLHRYYDLRKRILGLPDLQPYDLSIPIASIDRSLRLPKFVSSHWQQLRH